MKKLIAISMLMFFQFRLYAQSLAFMTARNQANAFVVANGLRYSPKLNTYLGRTDDIIHIFMFEDGNLLLAGYPTTATQNNKFQIHLFVTNSNRLSYLMEYTGSYAPVLNIEGANTSVIAAAAAPGAAPIIDRIDFAMIGPFTSSLVLTVKRSNGSSYSTLTTTTIQIAKTIYASIGSGIIYSSLRDPSNIRKLPLGGQDSTLLGDNVKGRSLLTVFATFYPWGRNNLLMPSWSFKDRFGIIIGTTLGSGTSTFKNLLVGAQYDFSIGGSIVTGVHYGQRTRIQGVDYNDFEFGKSKFEGDLNSKIYQQGDVGFFLGIQLDSRIFSQLLR